MAVETRPFRTMLGVLTVLFGLGMLFLAFGFSTLVEPELEGVAWWLAVSKMMLGPGLFGLRLGVLALTGGIWLIASSAREPSQTNQRTVTIRQVLLVVAIVALLLAAYVRPPGPTVHFKENRAVDSDPKSSWILKK